MATDLLPVLYRIEESYGWSVGMRAVTHALLAGLALPAGPILEVGCGGGHLLAELRGGFPGHTICGADLDPRALAHAHTRLPAQVDVLQAPLQRLPFADHSFALLLALDAFDQQGVALAAALAESRRLLRPGGWLVVRVSAHRLLYGAHDLAFRTNRRYAKRELVHSLAAHGFRPHRVTYANFLVGGPVAVWRLLQRWRLLPWHPAIYTDRTANAVVAWALRGEARWLRRHDLPVGLSLWAVAEKKTAGVGSGV
jgi:SAM-dependent methyltransferase